MFTGIVQRALLITSLKREPGLIRLGIEFPGDMLGGLQIGASVALDGICMTVVNVGHNGLVSFDAVQGTIDRTTIGDRAAGDPINVERSLTFGSEIGGHMLSGHVSDTATIIGMDTGPAAYLQFTLPEEWQKYIFKRGYIALNGLQPDNRRGGRDFGDLSNQPDPRNPARHGAGPLSPRRPPQLRNRQPDPDHGRYDGALLRTLWHEARRLTLRHCEERQRGGNPCSGATSSPYGLLRFARNDGV